MKALFANVRKFLLLWIKLIIPAIAFIYIIITIYNIPAEQLNQWLQSFTFTFSYSLIIPLVIFLAAVNWYIESEKWRLLASSLQRVKRIDAFKSILFGVALGMVTPKRLGEFAGRIMILDNDKRVKGLLLNSAASFSQLSVTLIFGISSLVLLLIIKQRQTYELFFDMTYVALIAFSILLLVFSVLLFYQPLARYLSKIIKSEKWKDRIKALEFIKPLVVLKLLSLSILRYFVFVSQFYLLLILFGLNAGFLEIFILQSIIYLIMIVLPVSALAESGVKGSLSLLVFGAFPLFITGFYEAAVLSASLSLWFINLVLPALSGIFISFYEGIKLKLTL
ncbi:MAG: lysylphosphatidylglycerol synthase domain-containing protein [Bacteroidales bacterium]